MPCQKENKMETIKKWFIWLGHPILGALILIALAVHPVCAILWVYLYVKYEGQEFKEIRDTCAQDLKDFMTGFCMALIAVFLWRLLNIK